MCLITTFTVFHTIFGFTSPDSNVFVWFEVEHWLHGIIIKARKKVYGDWANHTLFNLWFSSICDIPAEFLKTFKVMRSEISCHFAVLYFCRRFSFVCLFCWFFCCCLFCFETGSPGAQADFELMTMNFWSASDYFSSAVLTAVCCHAQIMWMEPRALRARQGL